jgi:uncharacterized membrane protein YhfC
LSPFDFIGTPDWRSAGLALVFIAPWIVLLGGRHLGRPSFWVTVALGAVLFPPSIAWVQVPIQQALGQLFLSQLPAATIKRDLLLFGAPSIVVSGLVQEVVKFVIGGAGLYLIGQRRAPRAGLAMGAASGAGYGGMEAFWVFNQIFAAGFTMGTVQLGGIMALLGFIERFFTVMFHSGVAGLSVYGLASGRPWRFLLLAIGLHSLTNYTALLLQAGALKVDAVEIVIAVISVATISAAVWIRGRLRRTASLNASGE